MRDPFGRFSVRKSFVRGAACDWCGTQSGKARRGGERSYGSYRYRTEHDGGRVDVESKTFCGADCRRSYQS